MLVSTISGAQKLDCCLRRKKCVAKHIFVNSFVTDNLIERITHFVSFSKIVVLNVLLVNEYHSKYLEFLDC